MFLSFSALQFSVDRLAILRVVILRVAIFRADFPVSASDARSETTLKKGISLQSIFNQCSIQPFTGS